MPSEEDVAVKYNVDTLVANSRALFNILSALVSVTLDSDQRHRLVANLKQHADAVDAEISQIPDERIADPETARHAANLKQESAAYYVVINAAQSNS